MPLPLFTVLRPHNRLLIFKFKTSAAMASTFMRLQEFAENPMFYNRTFSRKECNAWYKKTNSDIYSKVVDGCNVDGIMTARFIERAKAKEFGRLTYKEKALIKELSKYEWLSRSYVVAYGEDNADVLKHELAHALYNIDFCYRNQVFDILQGLNVDTIEYRGIMKQHGYCDGVFWDEIHAYLMEDFWYTYKDLLKLYRLNPIRQIKFWIAHRKLCKLFKNFCKYNALENILK